MMDLLFVVLVSEYLCVFIRQFIHLKNIYRYMNEFFIVGEVKDGEI